MARPCSDGVGGRFRAREATSRPSARKRPASKRTQRSRRTTMRPAPSSTRSTICIWGRCPRPPPPPQATLSAAWHLMPGRATSSGLEKTGALCDGSRRGRARHPLEENRNVAMGRSSSAAPRLGVESGLGQNHDPAKRFYRPLARPPFSANRPISPTSVRSLLDLIEGTGTKASAAEWRRLAGFI